MMMKREAGERIACVGKEVLLSCKVVGGKVVIDIDQFGVSSTFYITGFYRAPWLIVLKGTCILLQ